MASRDKKQDPIHESNSTSAAGDTGGRNAEYIQSDISIDMQEVMRLSELVRSATGEMKGLIDSVERCFAKAEALSEKEGIKFDDDIALAIKEIAIVTRSVADQVSDIAGAAVLASTQSLAQMGTELQKAVARMAVAHVKSSWNGSLDR